MRISTRQIHKNALDGIVLQQAQVAQSQKQLGSGRRIVVPSDDPTGAVQILDLQSSIAGTKRYQKNIEAARVSLEQQEGVLGSVTDLLQRTRELALQANSGLLDDQARQGIASEISERVDELLDLANVRDANGDYVFSGFKVDQQSFTRTATGFSYGGDDGQRFVQVGPARKMAVSESGRQVFQNIATGNGTFSITQNTANTGTGVIDPGTVTDPAAWVPDTYTLTFVTATTYEVRDSSANLVTSGTYQSEAAIAFNGIQTSVSGAPAAGDSFEIAPSAKQDIFTTLDRLATALNKSVNDPASQAALANDINKFLVDAGQAFNNFTNQRASLGSRLQALEQQKNSNDDFVLLTESALADVQDLDYPQAISLFNQQMVALQAAQQSFVRVQSLSLFNYL
ncbi:MAG TPA: flagellar hook-associated protein 3 [Gammaproteobacteria bacterium]|nr:flagellar hook-associated protein 3 [Gammaproteobacteria bacterium]